MLCIFVGIVAFIISIIFFQPPEEGKAGKRAKVLICLLIALTGFAIAEVAAICIIPSTDLFTAETTTDLIESREIVALVDSQDTKGTFFLGSGSVRNKLCYHFFYKTEHGAVYDSVYAKGYPTAYLNTFPEGADTPRIDEYRRYQHTYYTGTYDPIWFSVLTHFICKDYEPGDLVRSLSNGGCRYEIFVPEGSILEDFSIDLN